MVEWGSGCGDENKTFLSLPKPNSLIQVSSLVIFLSFFPLPWMYEITYCSGLLVAVRPAGLWPQEYSLTRNLSVGKWNNELMLERKTLSVRKALESRRPPISCKKEQAHAHVKSCQLPWSYWQSDHLQLSGCQWELHMFSIFLIIFNNIRSKMFPQVYIIGPSPSFCLFGFKFFLLKLP